MKIEEIVQNAKQIIENFIAQYSNWVIVIRWATATGKTKLSVLLSQYFDIEIISADSRQFFREMNIGTDKISQEILKKIPHHQIDIINPDQTYTAGQRKKDTEQHIQEIQKRWKIPMIVGWTGLYIDTIYKNFNLPECKPNQTYREQLYKEEEQTPGTLHKQLQKTDPKAAEKIHPNSTRYLVRALEIYHETWKTKSETNQEYPVKRPLLMTWLWRDKESTNTLIDKRIEEMLTSGLVKEVETLLQKWYHKELQSMQGIGYKETVSYIDKQINIEGLKELLQKHTHHLAKKQRTRFRRYIADAKNNPKENVTYKVYEL